MYGHPPFDLFEAIYTTRSMRRLKPDPVPPEIIVKVIEAATMGPSGSNRQPWIFLVVREPEMKEFVAVRYRAAWERYFTPSRARIVAKDPAEPARPHPSLGAVPGRAHRRGAGADLRMRQALQRSPRAGQPMQNAMFPAIQNLCLAARGYGLGTSITGLHMMFADEIDKKLGVPPEYANIALIPMGYPKGRWGRPDRKPALSVTFWEKWGARCSSVLES